jgi:hypothetical protein
MQESEIMNEELRRISSQFAIQQALARYCRGVDRIDRALLESAYWPDGYDDHVAFAGAAPEFIDWVLELLSNDIATSHSLGQSLFALEGRRAVVETYFQARSHRRAPGGEILSISSGRYVDQFEEREGEWRILNRKVLLDLRREIPLPPEQAPPPGPEPSWKGQQGLTDPSYQWPALKAL